MPIKMSTAGSARVRAWKEQASLIYDDLVELGHVDDLHARLRAIFLAKKDRIQNWTIPNWMHLTYITTICIGIRRAVDRRRDAVSLVRLLDDMGRHSGDVSFDNYLAAYNAHRGPNFTPYDDAVAKQIARKQFASFTESEGANSLPAKILEGWRVRVDNELAAIDLYASGRIAHLSSSATNEISLTEARRALQTMFEATRFVMLALDATDIMSPVPWLEPGWDKILRFAWLEPGESVPDYDCLYE